MSRRLGFSCLFFCSLLLNIHSNGTPYQSVRISVYFVYTTRTRVDWLGTRHFFFAHCHILFRTFNFVHLPFFFIASPCFFYSNLTMSLFVPHKCFLYRAIFDSNNVLASNPFFRYAAHISDIPLNKVDFAVSPQTTKRTNRFQ